MVHHIHKCFIFKDPSFVVLWSNSSRKPERNSQGKGVASKTKSEASSIVAAVKRHRNISPKTRECDVNAFGDSLANKCHEQECFQASMTAASYTRENAFRNPPQLHDLFSPLLQPILFLTPRLVSTCPEVVAWSGHLWNIGKEGESFWMHTWMWPSTNVMIPPSTCL